MTVPVFVDANVFVYRHDSSDPSKQACAEQWIRLLVHSRSGRLSFQVLQELYASLTHEQRLNFDRSKAQEIVKVLATWQPVAVDLAMLERAWSLSLVLVGRAHYRRRTDLRVQSSADRGPARRPRVRRGSGGQSVCLAGPDAGRDTGSFGVVSG